MFNSFRWDSWGNREHRVKILDSREVSGQRGARQREEREQREDGVKGTESLCSMIPMQQRDTLVSMPSHSHKSYTTFHYGNMQMSSLVSPN